MPFSPCLTAMLVGHSLLCAELMVPQENGLPSLNYWELIGEVIKVPSVQEALEISPEQRQRLSEMRARKDLALLRRQTQYKLRAALKRDRTIEPGNAPTPVPSVSFSDAWSALDDVVLVELKEILLPEQVDAIRPLFTQKRFPFGYSAFSDSEVAEFCQWKPADTKRLQPIVQMLQKQRQSKVKEITRAGAARILYGLPLPARELLVQYLGTSFETQIPVRQDIEFDSIPFPGVCTSISGLYTLLEIKDIQTALKLSKSQLEQLQALQMDFRRDTAFRSNAGELNKIGKSAAQRWAQAREKCSAGFQKILSNEQKLTLARVMSLNIFLSDFRIPFKSQEVIRYLQLSPEDEKAIWDQVNREFIKYSEQVENIDRADFLQLFSEVPTPSQARLAMIMQGVSYAQ